MLRNIVLIVIFTLIGAIAWCYDATPTVIDGISFTEITAVDVKATSTTFEIIWNEKEWIDYKDRVGIFFDIDIGSATDTAITFVNGDFDGNTKTPLAITGIAADKKYWVGALETFQYLTFDRTIKFTVTSTTIQTAINMYLFYLK